MTMALRAATVDFMFPSLCIVSVVQVTQSLVIAGKINLLWASSDEKRSEIEQESAPVNGLSY
jgi:hypothetical protein